MFIVARCSNRSPFGWLFVECLEVTGGLLKSEKLELQFLLYKLFVSDSAGLSSLSRVVKQVSSSYLRCST